MLTIKTNYSIKVINDATYSLKSADNIHQYDREYILEEGYFSSKYGIFVESNDSKFYSCIILVTGGATGPSNNSVIIKNDTLFLAYVQDKKLQTIEKAIGSKLTKMRLK